MSKIDYQKLREIPIADVLARYENDLREANVSGDVKLVGHCPICHGDGGKKPRANHFQATIKSDNEKLVNTFHCFACEARGTVVDFVVLKEGLVDFRTVDWLEVAENRKNGKNWCPKEALKQASELLWRWFFEEKAEGNVLWVDKWGKEPSYWKFYQPNEYLESRAIEPEVLKEFGVGYYFNPHSKSAMNGHILFPIHSITGKLVSYAWRTTEENGQRYWFAPEFKKSLELFNLHRAIKEGSKVLVVEGFFDCMNLWQLGHRCVVAVMGSTISPVQALRLIEEFETATFVLDPDEAGRKLGKMAIKELICRMPIRIVRGRIQPDEMCAGELETLLQ